MEATTTNKKVSFLSNFFGNKNLSQKLREELEHDKNVCLKPKEISEKFLETEGYRKFSVSYKLEPDSSEILTISINDTDESFMLGKEPGEKWKKL